MYDYIYFFFFFYFPSSQDVDMEDPLGKNKQQDNPFIEPSQQHAVVDMKGQTLQFIKF